jgi:1-phosphofructokinase family hexose kinase
MSALILALNPSIDAEWQVDEVQWEEKNIVRSERRWAGGKGINVARWLRYLGGEPGLLLPLGAGTGAELEAYLHGEKLRAKIVPLSEATRVNVVVTTRSSGQLRFNPVGPELSREEWNHVNRAVTRNLKRFRLLILSGSLPRGVPATAYAGLVRLARRAGVNTLLDCDGQAFAAGVKARPFLVKPNEHELAQWWGRPLRSESDVVRATRVLAETTGGWVLVSRGAKKVLLLNQKLKASFSARPPRVAVRNTVGSGDAMLAAVARQIVRGAPPDQWLRSGIATGTAATQCAPGELPARSLVQRLSKRIRLGSSS